MYMPILWPVQTGFWNWSNHAFENGGSYLAKQKGIVKTGKKKIKLMLRYKRGTGLYEEHKRQQLY